MKNFSAHTFLYKNGSSFSASMQQGADWDSVHEESIKKNATQTAKERFETPIEINESPEISQKKETRNKLTSLSLDTDLNIAPIQEETIDEHFGSLEKYFQNIGAEIEQIITQESNGKYKAQDILHDLGNPKYETITDVIFKKINNKRLQKNLKKLGDSKVQRKIQDKSPSWDAPTFKGFAFIGALSFVYARSFEGMESEHVKNLVAGGLFPLITTNGFGYLPKVNGDKPIVRAIAESAGGIVYEYAEWSARFGFSIMDTISGKGVPIGESLRDTAEKFMNAATGPWGKTWDLNPERYGETPEEVFWKRLTLFSKEGPTQVRDFFAFIITNKDKKAQDLNKKEKEQLHKVTKGAVAFMLEMEVNQPALVESQNDPAFREKDALKQVQNTLAAALESNPVFFMAAYKELLSQKLKNPPLEQYKWKQSANAVFTQKMGQQNATKIRNSYDKDLSKYRRNQEIILKPNGEPLGGYNGIEIGAGLAIAFRALAGMAVSMTQFAQGQGGFWKTVEKMKSKKSKNKELSPSTQAWAPSKKLRSAIKDGVEKNEKDLPKTKEIAIVLSQLQKTGAINKAKEAELIKMYSNDQLAINFWRSLKETKADGGVTYGRLILDQKTKKESGNLLLEALEKNALTLGSNNEKMKLNALQQSTEALWKIKDETDATRKSLRDKKNPIKKITFTTQNPQSNGLNTLEIEDIKPSGIRRSGDMKIKGQIDGKPRKLTIRETDEGTFIQYKDIAGNTVSWSPIQSIQRS